MIRLLSLLFTLPFLLPALQGPQILSYDVRAAVNERTGSVNGTVSIRIAAPLRTDGGLSFLVPSVWSSFTVTDRENETVDQDRSEPDGTRWSRIILEQNDALDGDTVALQLQFSAVLDSSATAPMFITPDAFFLPVSDSLSWLPSFGPTSAQHVSFFLSTAPAMSIVGSAPFIAADSISVKHWSYDRGNDSASVSLHDMITVCGIRNAVRHRVYAADSSISVTIVSSGAAVDQGYAAAMAAQLADAAGLFGHWTKQRNIDSLQYIIVGDATFSPELFRSDRTVIRRGSPVFTVFDSSSLNRFEYNPWLTDVAQRFCPATTDTSALFDDGLASYLMFRYLALRYPSLERAERLSVIANALTFFPSGVLAAGHPAVGNSNEILSVRGGYVLLMLDYLLGRPSFDSVLARVSTRYRIEPLTETAFRTLCEEEYGTPLDWFFQEWLHRSTAPEYVMQWKPQSTPRGTTVVTVTMEQRGIPFTMPVPVLFTFGTRVVVKRVLVEQMRQEFRFTFPSAPTTVELDPSFAILRWLREIRISSHARTSLQYLSVNRDAENAEREAQYTLQLDPNNSTGTAPLVLFVLGNSAAAKGDLEKGKEYFLRAMSAGASPEMEKYKLLSLVQFANILEAEGKRDEAETLYRRAVEEGMQAPMLYERAIIKARLHLRNAPGIRTDAWFELH